MRKVPYPTPGEILLEEFLKPMGITQYRLPKEIGVPQRPPSSSTCRRAGPTLSCQGLNTCAFLTIARNDGGSFR